MRRVERGEVSRAHLVCGAVEVEHAPGGINVFQKQPVLHVPVGMAHDDLPLELEENDRDGLLHGRHAVVLRVGCLREERQLAQAHTIGALEDREALVVDVVANHGRQARGRARGRAHPHDVVVAPLDVDGVVAHEAVADLVGMWSSVKDVAYQVHVVHGQTLDERRKRADEVVCRAGVDDRVDDALVVGKAGLSLVGRDMQELVDDVGVRYGHGLAHLGAGVRAGEPPRETNEPHERDGVPLAGGRALLAQASELLGGVVDERAEVGLLACRELEVEDLLHALADDARAVVEDVLEGLVLAVDVRDKVLGALGQVEDGLKIDDLGERCLCGRELLGEKLEVLELVGVFLLHVAVSLRRLHRSSLHRGTEGNGVISARRLWLGSLGQTAPRHFGRPSRPEQRGPRRFGRPGRQLLNVIPEKFFSNWANNLFGRKIAQ